MRCSTTICPLLLFYKHGRINDYCSRGGEGAEKTKKIAGKCDDQFVMTKNLLLRSEHFVNSSQKDTIGLENLQSFCFFYVDFCCRLSWYWAKKKDKVGETGRTATLLPMLKCNFRWFFKMETDKLTVSDF